VAKACELRTILQINNFDAQSPERSLLARDVTEVMQTSSAQAVQTRWIGWAICALPGSNV
jgi:hypothetical protein